MYWYCSHETLRYEEVPLWIEAGVEIIPSMGDPKYIRYDQDYNNERSPLYPDWRTSCTIPPSIVDRIRGIDIDRSRGKVSKEEAELFNRWIDIMYIASFSDIASNVMDWFQGYIVFRVFGNGDRTSYTEITRESPVVLRKFNACPRYVWSPILFGLDELEDARMIKNKLFVNAFVSPKRMGHTWAFEESLPTIVTTISYLDDPGHPARDLNAAFFDYFSDIPYRVLGKNDRSANVGPEALITGYSDHETFFSTIAKARIFVYIGAGSYYHLHFTPLEAVSMGVPVLFLESSGIAKEARIQGVTDLALIEAGMCASIAEIRQRVLSLFHQREALQLLASTQQALFGKLFGRKQALKQASAWVKKIRGQVKETRTESYSKSITYNRLASKPVLELKTNLPSVAGRSVAFRLDGIRGLTGTAMYDAYGNYAARRATVNVDRPGMVIGEYLPAMNSGLYQFSVVLAAPAAATGVGTLAMGAWMPDFVHYGYTEINEIAAGQSVITLLVHVGQDSAHCLKELRLMWDGVANIDVCCVYVDKLS